MHIGYRNDTFIVLVREDHIENIEIFVEDVVVCFVIVNRIVFVMIPSKSVINRSSSLMSAPFVVVFFRVSLVPRFLCFRSFVSFAGVFGAALELAAFRLVVTRTLSWSPYVGTSSSIGLFSLPSGVRTRDRASGTW